MKEIILTCANLNLPETLNALTVPSDAVMFLERVPSQWLDKAEIADGIRIVAYDAATDWAQWGLGRIFCEQWELRWEKQSAVYTGVDITLPNFTAGSHLSSGTRQEASYYLWGERDGNRFIEIQVARILTYPVTIGNRVKLRVAEWFDATGELMASRFIGLEGE